MKTIITPWGPSQSQRTIAEGITFHSTASHGGIHLSQDRWREFRALFPTQTLWAGDRWFEEDLDYCLVVLAFPEHFSDETIFNSVRAIEASAAPGGCGHEYLGQARLFLTSERGKVLVAQARAVEARMKGRWEVTSYGSAFGDKRDAWGVGLRNTDSGERKRLDFKDMPEQQFYTDSELAQAAA
jgi:hypothetical protein